MRQGVPEELNEWLRRRITLLKMLDEAALPVEECMVPGLGKISLAARAAAEHVLFGGDSEGTTAGSLVVDAVRCGARKVLRWRIAQGRGYWLGLLVGQYTKYQVVASMKRGQPAI